MPVLRDAINLLGLRPEVVETTASAMLMAADHAMRTTEPRRGEVSDYIAAHALRGIGMVALIDQEAARDAARATTQWLAEVKHPGWPLAAAALDHHTLRELLTGEDDIVRYKVEATGYPGELLRIAAGQADDELGPDDFAGLEYSRSGLAPYGVNLRLLHGVVRGGNTTEFGLISEPSAPAVVDALLGSVQDVLDQARLDKESWDIGAGPIAATDPEVLLTLHALRRSPSSFGLQFGAERRPSVEAALMVVEQLDPW
ncbi:hypothetical protein [Serinicoccus hydrothermalis]|uniref:hypothetical protein n=1 Tax=Serinicoccus hydrothermalis TaxID=1758689 RepID=UPI0008321307|nr:hypothetical protein [Serinicoccus hydrothermalis]